MNNALHGLRVIDFTQNVAGPVATMLLGDFGADVIKIEPPEGDVMRKTGETRVGGEAAYFLSVNRNKRSVVLDLDTPNGRQTAQQLAATADVVFENFRPGVAERLGIGYDTLRDMNPGLIYCSTSAFGRTGPDTARPGMDPVVQAMAGVMQLTGDKDSGPLKSGVAFADVMTPLLSLFGVMVSLHARQATGTGQRVDVAMLDASIFGMMPREAFYFCTGGTPPRMGNAHYEIVPYNTYRTSDGRHIMVIAHNDKFWRILAEATGARALLQDPRLADKAGRHGHRHIVDAGLAQAFLAHSLEHWQRVLTQAGAMFAPVRTFDEVFNDPGVRERLLVHVEHPKAGQLTLVGNPIQLSGNPPQVRYPPPLLGQHTEEVLREMR
ncbi:CoA transferase [Pigmentiphaga sp.]|uniref:CaiB/BaiF CoA transferase family protein n=1 Tax=Pigmentiphaga sp. TaxID=1977564 RepID=UPI0025EE7DFE|nr:CoA transferase [Pigmentiphaga sp.]